MPLSSVFTGTPVEKDDINTRSIFGDYIDIYDISRAVEDSATVPIYYESRVARIEIDEDDRPSKESIKRMDFLGQAGKLSHTFAMLLGALDHHRGKGEQKVTVLCSGPGRRSDNRRKSEFEEPKQVVGSPCRIQ